jgi:DNA-binding protein HU-beta
VNKAELIDELARRVDLTKTDATRAVEALFGTDGIIASSLKSGDKVQITGFGSFQARKREARTGRDPRTGNPIAIKASTQPAFKAGQGLKDALNP